jgi:hypothetical protein
VPSTFTGPYKTPEGVKGITMNIVQQNEQNGQQANVTAVPTKYGTVYVVHDDRPAKLSGIQSGDIVVQGGVVQTAKADGRKGLALHRVTP